MNQYLAELSEYGSITLREKIDPDIVHSSIANILRDYPRYQRSIVQYLDSLEAENG